MKLKFTLPLLASLLAVGACSDSTDYDFDASVTDARAAADPPDLPFPTTLLFDGSEDGTLNIPLGPDVDPADFTDPRVALNTLDGFSTTQPITSIFSNPLDAATLVGGETVRVFEVTAVATETGARAVTGLVAEVPPQTYAVAVVAETTLAVIPVIPLKENADYMVVVTKGAEDVTGNPAVNSVYRLASGDLELVDSDFAALEGVRQLNLAMIQVAAAVGIAREDVVQIWSTKTQSITPVMNKVKSAAAAGGVIAMQPAGINTMQADERFRGLADIFAGTLQVPYYLTAPADANDPTGIGSFWTAEDGSFLTGENAVPKETSFQTIPVLMTVPNANAQQTFPDNGWPVAIFVHGITRDRSDMLAIADTMASVGYAVIAIDQPMHGITDTENNLYTPIERTFDIDLANNDTSAPGPDGVIDSSGTHFYSPQRLLTTRDNLRQSASDLLVLSASLSQIAAAPIDESRKALIGYSLGGTAATIYAAFDDTLSSVSLAMPAAGLVPMTIASPAFREPLIAGLSAAGLEEGTPEFSQFVLSAQTIVDSGDPINFGAQAAAMHNVHMMEVVGDETVGILSDQTVLNAVPGAPLSGSTPLARVMGLLPPTQPVVATDSGGQEGVSGLVRFIAGDHGSLLNPAASQAATVEMQSQVAAFAFSAGTLIKITDPSVILVPEQ